MNPQRLARVFLAALGVHAAACATISSTTRDRYEPLGVDTQLSAARDWRLAGEWLNPGTGGASVGVHVFRYRPCEKRISERQLHIRTTERTNETVGLTTLSFVLGVLGASLIVHGVQRTADGTSFTEKDPAEPEKPTPGQEVLVGSGLSLFLVGSTLDMFKSIDTEESFELVNSRSEPMQCERQDVTNANIALAVGGAIVESTRTNATGRASFNLPVTAEGVAIALLASGEPITELGPLPEIELATSNRLARRTDTASDQAPALEKTINGATLWGHSVHGLSREALELALSQRGILATESAANRQTYRLSPSTWFGLVHLLVLWDNERRLVGMALTGEQTSDQAHLFKTHLDAQFGAPRSDGERLVWDIGSQLEASYLVTGASLGKKQVHFSLTDLEAEQRVRRQIQGSEE